MSTREYRYTGEDFVEIWECEPPEDREPYWVVDDEWTNNHTERHIRAWWSAADVAAGHKVSS